MIQDILPLHMDNQYRPKEPQKGSRLLAFRENQILIKMGDDTDFLTYDVFAAWCEKNHIVLPRMVYLFAVGEMSYFLTELPETFLQELLSGEKDGLKVQGRGCDKSAQSYEFVRMFKLRGMRPKENVFVAATAWHLYCWYRDNQYCGRCGKRLVHSDKLRMMHCKDCDNQVFPKIAPAVIVGVTDGERILMTKYANREYKRYALIAGFAEIGETIEETVRREVLEEVGLHVKNIQYYKSQPWGFDSNLLMGFFCELDDSAEIHMDEEELAVAEWVHYSAVPEDVEGVSLTSEMMTVFCERNSSV